MRYLLPMMLLALTACSDVRFEAISDPNEFYGTTPGLSCEVFGLPPGLDRTPELESLVPDYSFVYNGSINQPIGTYYTNGLNVLPSPIKPLFLENFAVNCQGYLRVDVPGYYKLQVDADDGAELALDGEAVLLVDSNSYHNSGSVVKHLNQGIHRLDLVYRQGPRNHIAWVVSWAFEGNPMVVIPATNLVY